MKSPSNATVDDHEGMPSNPTLARRLLDDLIMEAMKGKKPPKEVLEDESDEDSDDEEEESELGLASPFELATPKDDPDKPDAADPVADALIERATGAVNGLARKIRREMVAIYRTASPIEQRQRITALLAQYQPLLARTFAEADVASILVGMVKLARKVPEAVAAIPEAQQTYLRTVAAQIAGFSPLEQRDFLIGLSPVEKEFVKPLLPKLPPPAPPFTPVIFPEGEAPEPLVRFTIIDEAVKDLAERQLLTRREFDALSAQARQKAFTVAGLETVKAIEHVQTAIVKAAETGGTMETFIEDAGEGSFLSPSHAETVFRNGIQSGYSRGMDKILAQPLVEDHFPYMGYVCIHDDRLRPNHLYLEKNGLDGTNIYRADDPIWLRFKPPWDWNDRCGRIPYTLRMAARAGVKEAERWLETGEPPLAPEWVKPPPFEPPAGFRRD